MTYITWKRSRCSVSPGVIPAIKHMLHKTEVITVNQLWVMTSACTFMRSAKYLQCVSLLGGHIPHLLHEQQNAKGANNWSSRQRHNWHIYLNCLVTW